MPKRWILVQLAVVALVPVLTAQMRDSRGPTHAGPGFGQGVTFTARNHPLGSRGFYLGDTPFFYTDYPFQQFAAEPASPQVVVMRSTAETQETKAEPLLIELRGGRYVRFGGEQKSAQHGVTVPPDYAEETSPKSAASTEPHARSGTQAQASAALKTAELRPAVLIYRDGRREEVSDYAIVGAVMYARGDYWRDGYWTKNIQLSALNISATLKTNQNNGVKFTLPSSPNEVVTRP
jgi:hypothetical protein